MKKEGSQGADSNSRSQTRESEVKLTGQTYGLGGIVGFLVGIGITAANSELRAYLTERKSTDEWGLKRARFLLDEIDEDLFLRKTARAPGELCEAYFYSGIKRLLTGDKSGAMDLFDTCTRFEIRGFVEHQLARIQMKELTEKPDGQ